MLDHDETRLEMPFRRGDLYRIRANVAAYATQHSVVPAQVDKIVLVASELVVNAVVHGGGGGLLRMWNHEGRTWCQVSDNGPGTVDPDAGMKTPTPNSRGGRGLWVVRSVSDSLDIESGSGGTTITACLASV